MTLTPELLKKIMPRCDAEKFAPILDAAMNEFGIVDNVQKAQFLAQIGHESCDMTRLEESLNYSAEGLARTWPSRFSVDGKPHSPPLPSKLALSLSRKPEQIANVAYANRMGNGSPESGDGWRYRGRGAIQTTGKENYEKTGAGIGVDLVTNPELLLDPTNAVRAAAWFWKDKNIGKFANDTRASTLKINGGLIGIEDRELRFLNAMVAFKMAQD